jgi:hypothetical protein
VSTLHTLTVEGLRAGWTRKPTFFQVGKTYVWNRYPGGESYKVLDTYLIDKPISPEHDMYAFAVCTEGTGKQYGTSLSRGDFKNLKLK